MGAGLDTLGQRPAGQGRDVAVGEGDVSVRDVREAQRAPQLARGQLRDARAGRHLAPPPAARPAEQAPLEVPRPPLPLTPGSYRITEGFGDGVSWRGYGHTGLDFATPTGSPVFAVANGTVFAAQYAGGCGYMVEMRLDDGTEIKYCHNSSLATSVGAKVRVGDVIAYSGSTGHSTGPHVHLEVHPGGGDAVDPYAALVAHGAKP